MDLALTAAQQHLVDATGERLAAADGDRWESVTGVPPGYDPGLWVDLLVAGLVRPALPGAAVPGRVGHGSAEGADAAEGHGGGQGVAGGQSGVLDLVLVVEQLGRGPVPTPVHNGLVLSAGVLAAAGPGADGGRLAAMLGGRRFACCLADPGAAGAYAGVVEGSSAPTDAGFRASTRAGSASTVAGFRAPTGAGPSGSTDAGSAAARPGLSARPDGGGWVIDGVAPFVPYAGSADELVVVAPTPGRDGHATPVLLAVPSGSPGLSLAPVPTTGVDHQAHVSFSSVQVGPDGVLGPPGAAHDRLRGVLDVARVVLAAEMVGAAAAALDHAVRWATDRRQFGAPVGSFQAVQHRLADALIDVTTARDAVYDAASTLDRGEDAAVVVAGAKAHANEACRRVTAAAHQVCGGEGIFADQPLHRWHRRVAALVPVLGTTRGHRAVVAASLLGE